MERESDYEVYAKIAEKHEELQRNRADDPCMNNLMSINMEFIIEIKFGFLDAFIKHIQTLSKENFKLQVFDNTVKTYQNCD